MTTGNILGIFGIILTVFFGVLSYVLVLRYRNKVKLTYLKESHISLFQEIVKNMDGIEIYYEKQPISPSLFMLKGCLINTGTLDIDKSIIYEPPCMKLPQHYKWLKAKIVSSSPNIKVDCEIKDDSTLEFRWDLLKKNEFFRFDSLFQDLSDKEEIEKQKKDELLTFSHRITNLDKIEKEELVRYKKIGGSLAIGILFLIIGAFFIGLAVYGPARETYYMFEDSSGNNIEVSIKVKENNKIEIKGVENSFKKQIELEELQKHRLTPSRIGRPKFNVYISSLVILLGAFFVFIGLYGFFDYFNLRKMAKKLNMVMGK